MTKTFKVYWGLFVSIMLIVLFSCNKKNFDRNDSTYKADSIELATLHSRALEQTSLNGAVKYAIMERNYAHSNFRYNEEVRAMLLLFDLYYSNGRNDDAFKYAYESCAISDSIDDYVLRARSYHALGAIANRMKNSSIATKNFATALQLYMQMKDTVGFVNIWRDMARSSYEINMFDSAYTILHRCIGVDTQIGNAEGLTLDFAHLGATELAYYRYDRVKVADSCLYKACALFNRAQEMNKAFKNEDVREVTVLGLVQTYYYMSKQIKDSKKSAELLDSCTLYYKEAQSLARKIGDSELMMSIDLMGIDICIDKNEIKAARHIVDSLTIVAEESDNSYLDYEIAYRAQYLMALYDKNYQKALEYQNKAEEYSISRNNNIGGYTLTLQLARGQHEGEVMKARVREMQLKAKARMRTIFMGVAIVILIFVLSIAALIVRSYRRAKHHNQVITSYNEEILAKNEEISMQNAEIYDSISYASMIQTAAMPSANFMTKIFGENMVLLRPRNIVSGDFFWALEAKKTYKLVVVGDCTGHGVPGALLSMLGMSILDYITRHFGDDGEISAGNVLDRVRKYFKRTLNQDSFKTDKAFDSIDMSLLVFDTEKCQVHYAGAFRPLVMIRDGELTRIKADPMPIGVYPKEKPHFTNHIIDIKQGDKFYMFSDGMTDQSGYDTSEDIARAFSTKRFLNLLQTTNDLTFDEQKQTILNTITEWSKPKSSSQVQCEQTDDSIIMGLAVDNFMVF